MAAARRPVSPRPAGAPHAVVRMPLRGWRPTSVIGLFESEELAECWAAAHAPDLSFAVVPIEFDPAHPFVNEEMTL